MHDDECQEIFNKLTAILDRYNLAWITAQVNEQIRHGKIEIREVKTLKDRKDQYQGRLWGNKRYQPGSIGKYLAAVEYTACQRLLLLISAIEQTVVYVAEYGDAVTRYLIPENSQNRSVIFTPDHQEGYDLVFSRQDFENSEEVQNLADLLNELRSRVEDASH